MDFEEDLEDKHDSSQKYVLYVYPDWAIENSEIKLTHQKQRVLFRYRSMPSQAAGNIFVLNAREISNLKPIHAEIARIETHAYPDKATVADVVVVAKVSQDDYKFLQRNLKHYQ